MYTVSLCIDQLNLSLSLQKHLLLVRMYTFFTFWIAWGEPNSPAGPTSVPQQSYIHKLL